MDNHLIIGLGGTGGKVIASYRRQLVEKYGKLYIPELENIRFLWVDSSEMELKETGGMWNYMGQDISLGEKEKLLVKGGGLGKDLNELINKNNLKPWIGTKEDWGFIGASENAENTAGGQIRKLGRYNFSKYIKAFNENVTESIHILRANKTKQHTSVHIVAGLAGGTGSGSVIDAAAQIAKEYANENIFVYLYLVLPEQNPKSDYKGIFGDISFYHANGYATLKELNGFISKSLFPYDLTNNLPTEKQINVGRPFYNAFIVTEKNNGNILFNNTKVQAKIAEFLYMRTIAVQSPNAEDETQKQKIRELFHRAGMSENIFIDPDSNWGLSGQFSLFGIHSLTVPKQRIKDKFGYELLVNSLNKILYNNFELGEGYIKEEKKGRIEKVFNSIVQNEHYVLLDEWYVDQKYLTLNKFMQDNPFGDWGEGNNDIDAELNQNIDKIFTRLNSTKNHDGKVIKDNELLKYLHIDITRFVGSDFRKRGIESFFDFRLKPDNIRKTSEFITGRIKNKIFGIDKDGNNTWIPLEETAKTTHFLQTEYRDFVEKELKKKQSLYSKSVERLGVEIDNIKNEYVSTFGLVPKKNKREKHINNFLKSIKDYWYYKISLKGIEFAIQLLTPLCNDLYELEKEVDKANSNLIKLRDAYKKKLYENTSTLSKPVSIEEEGDNIVCSNNKSLDKFETILKQSPESFASIIKPIEKNLLENFNLILNSDSSSIEKLIENTTFSNVDKLLSQDNFRNLKLTDDFYDVNIIDLLSTVYNGNVKSPELSKIFDDLTKLSLPMAQSNGEGIANTKLLVIMPKYVEAKDNGEGLAFYKALRSEIERRGAEIQEGGFTNEIAFMHISFPVTLDTIRITHILKDNYFDILANKNYPNAKFLMHLQNPDNLVELKIPLLDEFVKRIFPYLLILEATDSFKRSGENLAIIATNEDGTPDMANSLILESNSVKEFVNSHAAEKLHGALNLKKIKEEAEKVVNLVQDKKQILNKIKENLESVFDESNNNIQDKTYLSYLEAYNFLKTILN